MVEPSVGNEKQDIVNVGIVWLPIVMYFVGAYSGFLDHTFTKYFLFNAALIISFHFLPSLVLFFFHEPKIKISKFLNLLLIIAATILPVILYITGMIFHIKGTQVINSGQAENLYNYKFLSPQTIIPLSLWPSFAAIYNMRISKIKKIVSAWSLLIIGGAFLFWLEGIAIFLAFKF